jgi:CubicO group peptidase (beta-lactamase class C family)
MQNYVFRLKVWIKSSRKKMMKLTPLILLQIYLIYACGTDTSGPPDHQDIFAEYRQVRLEESGSFSEFLVNIQGHYNIPGIAAALVSNASILEIGVAGVRKFGESSKTEMSDIFSIGSCAKSMTAVIAATLVEEGLISWETKPLDIYPELTGEINADFRNMTLKDLLSHQAGVEPFYDDGIFNVYSDYPFITGSPQEQRQIFAVWQFKRSPVNDPGSFVYSNGGYAVAAAMLEKVSGQSWEELIKVRLFNPLNMSSAFIGMPFQNDIDQPWRHYHRDNKGNPIPLPISERMMPELINPAGNVSLNIHDFARYAMFHLRGLAGKDGMLKSKTIKYLHEPQIKSEENQAYALGWGLRWFGEAKVSGHSGGDRSVFATIGIDHQNLLAGVVLCNMGDSRAEAACVNTLIEIMP